MRNGTKRNGFCKYLFIIVTISLLLSVFSTIAWAADENSQENRAMYLENTVLLTSEEQAYLKSHPSIVMAGDASWCPMEYLDNDQQYAGVISEITSKIEDKTGLKIEYKVMDSYTEALEAVQSGEADVLSGIANDEEIAEEYNMTLSDPYLSISSAVVSNKKLTDLYQGTEHKKIAVVAGDYANADIRQRIPNSELIECDSNEECLKKVSDNSVDMAIIASYCAEHYLNIPKYSDLYHHLLPDFTWEQSFGINAEADPLLVSILNKGIHAISQVDLNDAVYTGITDADYNNVLLEFVYRHPLLVISLIILVVLFIGLLLLIIFLSRKAEQMRKVEDGTRLRLALERTHLCIWQLDIASKKIIQIDNEQEKHAFYELRDNIPESVIEKGYIHPEDVKYVRDVLERVQNGEQDVQGCWRVREHTADITDTTYWWEQVLFHIVYDEHHRPLTAIGVSEDVTKEKDAQRDALTSVYNRNSFEQRATQVLKERRNSYLKCAFLILDLDGFKQINDTYGHGMGDRVLISVGATLNQTFRSTDIVGRLGGDEFTVFMTSISRIEDVKIKAAELVENINKISEKDNYPFAISCSVGISVGMKGKDDLPEMYKKADAVLYEAKRAGKNRYRIHDSEFRQSILVVDDIEINRAILRKSLSMEYEVLEAENGIAALKVLEENGDVDLVLTDIVMPEMDGKELIKRIRKDENLRDVAIIAQTSYGDKELEEEILPLGVDDFIYKAASASVIQMRVGNVMKTRKL